jgi:acid phosphatase class B
MGTISQKTIMKTTTVTRACGKCIHWNKLKSGDGECRRHAPQTVAFEIDDEVKFESKFPVTASEDWCGDFTPKTD